MALQVAQLLQDGATQLLQEYFDRVGKAEKNLESEFMATQAIQRQWRGYVVRQQLEYLAANVVKIQRFYRGYRGRKECEKRIVQRRQELRHAYYSQKLVSVQKLWRGYIYRRVNFDFYARKKYLIFVEELVDKTKQSLDEYEKIALERHKVREAELTKRETDRVASRLHHLLGTKAIPGVLKQSPISNEVKGRALVVTEDKIRDAFTRQYHHKAQSRQQSAISTDQRSVALPQVVFERKKGVLARQTFHGINMPRRAQSKDSPVA